MSPKGLLRELMPPAITGAIKQFRRFQKTYNTFNDALKDCSGSAGYEDSELINVIVEETKEYLSNIAESRHVSADQTIFHTMFPFSLIRKETKVNVLDIGGSCGMHYFPIKKILGNNFSVNWHVIETKALSEAAVIFENDELKFFNNISDAVNGMKDIDVIICSGSLQYLENPLAMLKEITNFNARFILLTRLSLTLSDHDIISVQKSYLSQNSFEKLPPGYKDKVVKYPHTNIVEKHFKNIIEPNYKIKVEFEDTSGIQMVNFHKSVGYGLLLEKR